jgi:hypothetical protein
MYELSQFGKQMSIRMCHHVQLLLVTFTDTPRTYGTLGGACETFQPSFVTLSF